MHAEPSRNSRGVRFGAETLTFVAADSKLRPLRDQIILEPLQWEPSETVHVEHHVKPLRGIVKAIGPGVYPKRYDHPEKHKRTKMWDSTRLRPCDVKVGETVELGGLEIQGYAFETFYWGDVLHVICREADVAGVVNP